MTYELDDILKMQGEIESFGIFSLSLSLSLSLSQFGGKVCSFQLLLWQHAVKVFFLSIFAM
jgi:hypothetical protein